MAPKSSIKIVSWNCRGLWGPSIISHLKETMKRQESDLTFICETKQKKPFVQPVCRKLKLADRWQVIDPVGRSGVLLLFGSQNIQIVQIIISSFCIEVENQSSETKGRWWEVFVYNNVDDREKQEQWADLVRRRQN